MKFRVKICGITRVKDALEAVEFGAGALGFVFYPASPRFLTFSQAEKIIGEIPEGVEKIGVFVQAELKEVEKVAVEIGLTGLQIYHLSGTPESFKKNRLFIKAFRVKNALPDFTDFHWADCFLLDSFSPAVYGGSGERFNWELLKKVSSERPLILAGGLTPENVYQAILNTGVQAVDVSSGVESSPGVKDRDKLRRFIRNARLAFEEKSAF